jgi:hypothetical protein
MRRLIPAALAAVFTASAAPAQHASDPAALRAAYGEGYWEGYAAAARPAADGRVGRALFGLSLAEPSAPVWVMRPEQAAPGAILEMPAYFAAGGAVGAVYFKGPWLWQGDGLETLFRSGSRGPGLDLDALGRTDALRAIAELEPGVADRIRRMRSMGINEGLVIVRDPPVR